MRKTSLLLTALLVLPACDNQDNGKKDASAKADASDPKKDPNAPAAEDDPAAAPAEADPWQAKLDARVLANSGLGVGGKLTAFEIINAESGEKYCQVCRFGASPKLMAVGTADDENFRKDLKDLDAIAHKYEDKGLKAFAVITDLQDGKAVTPGDAEAAKTRAAELKKELGITIPVVVPAPEDGGSNRVWDEYYNITQSRTVMFSDGRNEVKWTGVGPEDWSTLNQAIVAVVEST